MSLECHECSRCGADYLVNSRRLSPDGFAPSAGDVPPALKRPACSVCFARLVDLRWYAERLQDIATSEQSNRSGTNDYVRLLSGAGVVELSASGYALRAEYFRAGERSVVEARDYESRSAALAELRSWLSDGDVWRRALASSRLSSAKHLRVGATFAVQAISISKRPNASQTVQPIDSLKSAGRAVGLAALALSVITFVIESLTSRHWNQS